MLKKLFTFFALMLSAVLTDAQQATNTKQDTAAVKGRHQVKNVSTRVIKLDKPVQQQNRPLPPMKTRQDTLRYLIEQHKQQQQKSNR